MTRNEAIIYLMRAISDVIDVRIPIGSTPDWYQRQHEATNEGQRALVVLGVTQAEGMALINEAFPVDDPFTAVAQALDLGVPIEDIIRGLNPGAE